MSDSSGVAVPSRLLVASDGARTRAIVRNIGWALIGAQLIGLLVWSAHVASRGAMSWDFAAYYQPWWAIAEPGARAAASSRNKRRVTDVIGCLRQYQGHTGGGLIHSAVGVPLQ